MSQGKMSSEQVEANLEQLPGWELKAGKLHRELEFNNFVQAFGFMSQAAILVEQMNHHPEWSNVYNQVTIDLVSHDVDGVSQRDFDLAEKLEGVLAGMVVD